MKKLILTIALIFTATIALGQSVDDMVRLDDEARLLCNQSKLNKRAI